MEKKLLDWLKANVGKSFSSPRTKAFKSRTQDFKIIKVDEEKERVIIQFSESHYPGLPLTFSMFDRTLNLIKKKEGNWVRLGTSIKPTDEDTIEGEIWKRPFPIGNTTYKTASHVCDILVLSGFAEYGYTRNPKTGRQVQAVRVLKF